MNDESESVKLIERDDRKHKPLLPEKREGVLVNSINCGHGRLCKRMNDESDLIKVIERDDKIYKTASLEHLKREGISLDESSCGHGRLCKRTNDETQSVKINERDDKKYKNTLPGNLKRNDESDSLKLVDGRGDKIYKLPQKRDDAKHKPLLPQKREGILLDSLSCGHGRLCKRMNDESDSIKVIERDSIIPKPDCASHLCKKRSLNEGETILEEKKRDSFIPKPDCSGHLCKRRSILKENKATYDAIDHAD